MKLDRVVVGIDFSPASIDTASWVARHFAPGAELVLVHVISLPEPPPIVASRYPRRDLTVDTLREGAEKRLREISLSLSADRVWLEIREGEIVESLTAVAEDYSADLVVAGTHGERAGLLEGLGSTAEHLVRSSTRPVLLVTHPRLTTPQHVLVPVDKPEHEPGALRLAGDLSRQFGARVTVLHVVTSGVATSAIAALAVVSGTPQPDVSAPLPHGEPDPWIEGAVAAGVPREHASSEVVLGEPTREILAAATRLEVDLVIMGRRSGGSLRRAVLGSVTAAVLRDAPCPVLAVPEPPAKG